MARLFLLLNTVLFLGFGVFALLNTAQLADTIGAATPSVDGLYELRSNYGGVSLGIGLMCLAGGLRVGLQRPALFCLMAYTGGYALGRALALPAALELDGPSPALLGYAVYEAVTATLAAILLIRLKTH